MQFLDTVRIKSGDYSRYGYKIGDKGVLLNAEIRWNEWLFYKTLPNGFEEGEGYPVFVGDLELVQSANMSDEAILGDLPANNPAWWCKVHDGYIWNLKGERKNKVPYDYNS